LYAAAEATGSFFVARGNEEADAWWHFHLKKGINVFPQCEFDWLRAATTERIDVLYWGDQMKVVTRQTKIIKTRELDWSWPNSKRAQVHIRCSRIDKRVGGYKNDLFNDNINRSLRIHRRRMDCGRINSKNQLNQPNHHS
jgi:hypothetical protein